MKVEVINLTTAEQRILLLFDEKESRDREEIDAYLTSYGLEPKRRYTENRDTIDYLVYYFGRCYLDEHINQLAAMATDSNLASLQPHQHDPEI